MRNYLLSRTSAENRISLLLLLSRQNSRRSRNETSRTQLTKLTVIERIKSPLWDTDPVLKSAVSAFIGRAVRRLRRVESERGNPTRAKSIGGRVQIGEVAEHTR